MPNITVAISEKMFPATHVSAININLPFVLNALQQTSLTSTPIVPAALATIRAETEGFVPISEGVSRFNTSPGGHAFDLYDNRKDLGNKGAPDGATFKGRGYIQLTGRFNYEKFGPIIGMSSLAADPDKANDPGTAGLLLAAFIKAHEIALNRASLSAIA